MLVLSVRTKHRKAGPMTAISQSKPSVEFANESPDNNTNRPTRGISLKWIWLGIVVVLAGIVLVIVSQRDTTHPEETRAKAEAVLKARFNDTMKGQGVPELKSMSVTWKGDALVATWTQGEAAQKRCTAPVLVSPDGQSFGIAAFQAVPFDKQDSAPATCVSTEGLQYGLPLGG